MLQQTQVSTVLPYYKNWLRRFPTFSALARASENEVLHGWQGLGYYARARNLHSTAKRVVNQHRGRFPKAIDEMRELPGIGKYTAQAIATFSFNQPVPIVEANTARALSRLFDLRLPIDSAAGRNKLWNSASALVPKQFSAAYNSALLDLGAIVCLPRAPKCAICPVKKFCRVKNPESLPVKQARPVTKQLIEKHVFAASRGKLLLAKSARRWCGMWILPPLKGDSKRRGAIYKAIFPFTNHRVTLEVFRKRARETDNQRERWFPFHNLDSIPIPSPHRRAIDALLN